MGSSPLTRGARMRLPSRILTPGLIPAHAGSTEPVHHGGGEERAHPRSRGEHIETGAFR
nr:hypothetical protein HMPREF0276_1792 [Corynebacterium accolens ATCC 49725]